MARRAQLRGLTFLLVLALVNTSADGQAPARRSPPAAARPLQPNLHIDVADPDRSAAEKNGQGMTGELSLDTPAAQVPADSSALSGSDAVGVAGSNEAHTPQIRVGSTISFLLADPLSSGAQHNGDIVRGTLAAPVTTTAGKTLPQGSTVTATVVSAAPAGMIASGGVLSIELTHVGGIRVVTDVRVFDGQPDHKDVADSNPGKGSEAEVPVGALLHFQVMN